MYVPQQIFFIQVPKYKKGTYVFYFYELIFEP